MEIKLKNGKTLEFAEGALDHIADDFESQEELDAFIETLAEQFGNMTDEDFAAAPVYDEELYEPTDEETNTRQ